MSSTGSLLTVGFALSPGYKRTSGVHCSVLALLQRDLELLRVHDFVVFSAKLRVVLHEQVVKQEGVELAVYRIELRDASQFGQRVDVAEVL